MFKILTVVVVLISSSQLYAFDSNANLVANLVRTELWYNGLDKSQNDDNILNSHNTQLSEELVVALEKFNK